MLATEEAKKLNYDQVLWMDAAEHKYVQEIGTMNVFFIIGHKAYTPTLAGGTILAGVTRDSVITILEEMGVEVAEEEISIEDLIAAHQSGMLKEVFGTGTAATISFIKQLRYRDYVMEFPVEEWEVAPKVKNILDDIRNCRVPDTHGWMFKV
jgi:branched-chain amino acid aminotransferase